MITILTMITTSVVFFMGVLIGYRLAKDKIPIELPKIKEIKEHIPLTKENKKKKEIDKQQQELEEILNFINNYGVEAENEK